MLRVLVACVTLCIIISTSLADDPSRYKVKSLLPRTHPLRGMHTTHNSAPHEMRKHQSDDRDFVNADGVLVHRYAIKIKDDTINAVKASLNLEERGFEDTLHDSDLNMDFIVAMNQRVDTIAEGHGFHYVKSIGSIPGVHIIERPSSEGDVDHQMEQSADIEWFEQLREPRQRVKRNEEDDWTTGQEEQPNGEVSQQQGTYSVYNVDLNFDDPLWNTQWNLADKDIREDTTRPGYPLNINVYPVWTQGVTGRDVIIGVVDDGVESRHPEFTQGNKYVRELAYNYNDDGASPEPGIEDKHGTACAGVAAAAANNQKCGVGVAYGARIANIKILGSQWTSDAEEATALTHACSPRSYYGHLTRFINDTNNAEALEAHQKLSRFARATASYKGENTRATRSSSDSPPMVSIYTSSWGPIDDGEHMDGPGRLTVEGMKHCTRQGRNGLGSIYIVAGGNGRQHMDYSNYDGYANSEFTVAVAAVGPYGGYIGYSEEGANIMCAMPSSGAGNRAILAPDLVGYEGYSSGDCDPYFGGTSAAAPQLAGMVALMLDANPSLTWRDVQHIIVRSSRMTRASGVKWTINSAARHHSMSLGFGVPDAMEAVRLSRAWHNTEGRETASSKTIHSTGMIYTNKDVNPGRMVTLTWNYTSPFSQDPTESIRLEHVHVTIEADTPMGNGYFGATLCGPSGVCSVLASEGHGKDTRVYWTFQTLRHWDEPIEYVSELDKRPPEFIDAVGPKSEEEKTTWTLRVANLYTYRSSPIHIDRWGIEFHGTLMRKPQQHNQ